MLYAMVFIDLVRFRKCWWGIIRKKIYVVFHGFMSYFWQIYKTNFGWYDICRIFFRWNLFFFHFLSPPLKPSHQAFFLHRLHHIISYHKLMHWLYIHYPIFELILQQKRIKFRFHFYLNFLFNNKDTVLTEIIINFRILPLPWAGKNKSDISSLFPEDALRMRNR